MDAQIQRGRESEIEGGREREKGGWRTDKLSERERWLVQGGGTIQSLVLHFRIKCKKMHECLYLCVCVCVCLCVCVCVCLCMHVCDMTDDTHTEPSVAIFIIIRKLKME